MRCRAGRTLGVALLPHSAQHLPTVHTWDYIRTLWTVSNRRLLRTARRFRWFADVLSDVSPEPALEAGLRANMESPFKGDILKGRVSVVTQCSIVWAPHRDVTLGPAWCSSGVTAVMPSVCSPATLFPLVTSSLAVDQHSARHKAPHANAREQLCPDLRTAPIPQVALVTGGSSGIGFEIARQLGKTPHAATATAFKHTCTCIGSEDVVVVVVVVVANSRARLRWGHLPAAPGCDYPMAKCNASPCKTTWATASR